MRTFGSAPRFELRADGTLYARAGAQTNCAGIAGIHARITPAPAPGIVFLVAAGADPHDDGYGPAVPASAVPAAYREAVFRGAREAYEQSGAQIGVCFELLDALVHVVDARERQFAAAGATALRGWLEGRA